MNQSLVLRLFNPLLISSRGCFQRRTRGRKIPVRKPIYFPMAPSKLYVIKDKPYFAEDEKEQYDALEKNHEDAARSLQAFLYQEVYLPTTTAGGFSSEEVAKELQEQERLLAENDAENERQKKRREEKTAWIEAQIEKEAMEKEAERLAAIEVEKYIVTEEVKIEIERSSTFITKENLEKFILKALDCPVSYEYAIDLEGRVLFDDKLHPYALNPSAVPETSDLELEKFATKDKRIRIDEKVVYK
ncbi:probable 28S ribosomal protein S26, mitochondrial [Tetranychus urticae]|uniref:Small ribosomal subunit protein mS26 n=1 Tax=Tetranychus urticae TaxID=32264 RepID=T1KTF6_TETUR|nr:probable 28S ribosomal protein S26, mitochondrial [Tetranychus urticae]